jgi:KDO2-lipid IV(A) lauroyltransferase
MGLPFDVVVRPLKGAINARIVRNRLRSGVNLILPKGAVQNALEALRQNHVVMQLIDQSMPPEYGVQVPFFGRMAWTTPGLSVAAAKSGASVLVMKVYRVGETLEVAFEGPVAVPQMGNLREDVKAHTADLSHRLENHIRQYPEQWLWLHRRWKGPAVTHTVTPQGSDS